MAYKYRNIYLCPVYLTTLNTREINLGLSFKFRIYDSKRNRTIK